MQKFQDKLQQLTKKISTLHLPCSLIQRQSKCKQNLQQIKRQINQKSQSIQQHLFLLEEKIDKYHQKIKSTKQSIKNFSLEKHSKFKQIIQQWVDQFNDHLKKAKQTLLNYQTAVQIKITQIQTNNSTIINNLKQKINKNLTKTSILLQTISTTMRQQRQRILQQFDLNRGNIQKLYQQKINKKKQVQKQININLSDLEFKIATKMQLSTQKWHVKDEKTQKILQVFIESKELF